MILTEGSKMSKFGKKTCVLVAAAILYFGSHAKAAYCYTEDELNSLLNSYCHICTKVEQSKQAEALKGLDAGFLTQDERSLFDELIANHREALTTPGYRTPLRALEAAAGVSSGTSGLSSLSGMQVIVGWAGIGWHSHMMEGSLLRLCWR